jgi:methylated-DNA-protein-cysteine methyltransferase-like protein
MSKAAKKTRRGEAATRRQGESKSPRVGRFEKTFEKIYRLVLRIPRGRVMTYGQIAHLLEERYSARLVGWAMHATPHDERNIPWHRVVNSRGGISTGRVILQEPDLQRLMLEAEGVVFDERGHCDLSSCQWSPRQRAARARINALRTARSRHSANRSAGVRANKKPQRVSKKTNQTRKTKANGTDS